MADVIFLALTFTGIRQRLVMTLHCRKDGAAIHQRLEIIRLNGERAIERDKRLIRPIQALQQTGMVIGGIGGLGIDA